MPCKLVSVCIVALLGNWERICLLGLFGGKGEYIWVPLLDPEDIKFLSFRAIWNCGKGTGLY
jgi:hypothetical protein